MTTNRNLVAAWLYAVCFMIWIMVGIGGFTRETGSGLSIMNWDPIIGAIPPLSTAAWNKLFALYQTIPQAQILHKGMDLAGFKQLFWPEYFHRLWGRLIGVVFFVPLLVFIATKRIEARLIPWLVLLFVLGGLQGAIGWFMVASGFDPNSIAVQPWRLTLHFSFAMFLYVAVLWTGLTVRHPIPAAPAGQRRLKTLGDCCDHPALPDHVRGHLRLRHPRHRCFQPGNRCRHGRAAARLFARQCLHR